MELCHQSPLHEVTCAQYAGPLATHVSSQAVHLSFLLVFESQAPLSGANPKRCQALRHGDHVTDPQDLQIGRKINYITACIFPITCVGQSSSTKKNATRLAEH